MTYSEDKNRSGEYLRLALGYLIKYDLPANPVNYTVWYEYVSGRNLKLKKAVDLSIKSDHPMDGKCIENFYQKYVTDGDRIVISRLLTQINLLLRDITHHILETEGDLAGHGRNLGNLAEKINSVHDFEGIREIVDQMLQETRGLIKSGSRLQSRMSVSSEDLKQLSQELEKSQKEAQTDILTGLANRRGLEKVFELERIRARQNMAPFCVVLMDIDHFKKVNDSHGHLVGDSMLKGISKILTQHLRKNDVAARFGGEEFLIVLPETDIDGACAVAKKIQKALACKEWKVKESGKRIGTVTVSMGVARYAMNEPQEDLIKRADKALYKAKRNGRNQVVIQADTA
jgi:diguanylate cyclase